MMALQMVWLARSHFPGFKFHLTPPPSQESDCTETVDYLQLFIFYYKTAITLALP